MKSAVATRFRCRSPLTDLEQLTPMFDTLILQYLNKLVERKIGDFTTPQAFHTLKVQGFNGNRIKLLTEFGSKLPMKIFALIADFPIQACELSHTPPPPVRTFFFTTQGFVERPKFVQVRFQRLWMLFLLTRAERQICVFHAEVCPNTLTRRWQRFRFYKVGDYIQPIVTTGISFDRDTTDVSIELTVLMERISNFILSPFTVIPFPEIEGEAIVFEKPTRLFEGEGLELMAFLDLRSTPEFLEKSVIRQVNASEFLLDGLTRQCFPMRVRRAFQLGYMQTHCLVARIRQSIFIPLTLPLMEVFMHLPHIVKQIAKPNTIRLSIKRIFVGFHDVSHLTPLTPIEWVGRHVTLRLRSICLPV